MRAFKATLLIVASFIMVGCASHPQTPLQLSQGFYTQKNQVVGVYQTHIPKPNTFFPGADCLLCLATAEAMNLSLTDHVHSFETEELNSLTISLFYC